MKLTITLFLSFLLFIPSGFAQTPNSFEKECRLAGGGGFANGFGSATGGPDIWLQMSYRLSKNFSVATEFENMNFKKPSFYIPFGVIDKDHDEQELIDNYISFLVKYHLPILSKISIAFLSGWTYFIRSNSFYNYEVAGNTVNYLYTNITLDDFSIPFSCEVYYPISKIFQVGARGKYNMNAGDNGTTYSAGLALSMKL
jgi:hypothetical protein